MYCYVARQPIFNGTHKVVGYELLFRDGFKNSFPEIDATEATSKLLTQQHLLLGVEKITSGKRAYINFTADTLIHHFPTSLNTGSVVIEILEDVPLTPELVRACKDLHEKGYQLALDDHNFDPAWDVLLPYIHLLKVDIQQFKLFEIAQYLKRIAQYSITLLAEKVETSEEFAKVKAMGFELFQGYFFARPELIKHKQLSPNKLNLLELIQESSKQRINFEHFSSVMERDVALSYKLLRFINSANFVRRQAIGSLKHAMVYMGESELKKFIALLALANLSETKSDELLLMSLIRARFCDRLAHFKGNEDNPPKAFLTGLFSLVDVLLEQPLDELLELLPLLPEIKTALLKQQGELASYIQLSQAYEQGLWQQQTEWALHFSISEIDLSALYLDAVDWAQTQLKSNQTPVASIEEIVR